jgi:recombination protein RecR
MSPLLEQLIQALRCLPGVGPKTAQRMAFYLLRRERDKGNHLAEALQLAMRDIGHCQQCRTFSEADLCKLCSSPHRDPAQLCIVENPTDIIAVEQMSTYRGHYFVLLGHLSPLDGIGPEDIGIKLLTARLNSNTIKEVILATNPTVEGEATAHYLSEFIKHYQIKITRIAHGVPLGGELENIDSLTLELAFSGRKIV